MSLLDILLGRQAQVNEQPIQYNMPPLQYNPNLGNNGLPVQTQNSPALKLIQLPMPKTAPTNTFESSQNGLIPGVDYSQGDYNNLIKQGLINPSVNMELRAAPEKTGILDDLLNGVKDNYTNSFNVNNLRTNDSKSIVNRVGEGIGTGLRVLNSPTGRGLITAGIVSATGGSPLQAMTYGATAGVRNQNFVMQDKLYRKALEDQGVDTSNLSGYMTAEDYDKISNGQYKNAYTKYLNDKLNNTKNSKVMSVRQLMDVSPEFKAYMNRQYDFSNGQNADLLDEPMPVDMIKNTGWLPKEVNVNSHVSGSTTKNIVKSGTSTSNIVHSGGTNSTKTNYGAKYQNPNNPKTKIMVDKNGNRAEVEVDGSGKPIRVIKDL